MIETNEILTKVTELSVINSKEIEQLKQKDIEIVTSVGTTHDLVNMLTSLAQGISSEVNYIKKNHEELKLDFEEYKHQSEKDKQLALNSLKVTNGYDGYCNQTEFGNNFRVKIGAKSVGRLLRITEIAMKSRIKSTVPYDCLCPCYCQPSIYTDKYGNQRQTFKWNYKKCIEKIDIWLKNHDLLEQFYSNTKPLEMEKYIANLHKTYLEIN